MTLKDKHIFILGTTRFDSLELSTSFSIAKELAKSNFVYYVDYPFTIKDCYDYKGTEQFRRRKSHFFSFSDGMIPTDNPNLKILILPPMLSINFLPEGLFYRSLLKINELLITRRLKRAIKRFKITDYIFFNSFNFHFPGLADNMEPALTVYHCVDPMIIPYDIKHGILSEIELVKKSDLVICTSRQLYNEKKKLNDNTYFIPNAADINISKQALDESLPVNAAISKLKKPVVGYTGTIERRIDYDLLKDVVTKNKEKSFVFVGPMAHEFVPEWFKKTPNIHLIGRLPHEEMPSVIKGFDIAIIPFKKDEVSGTIFPLKLFEYLGAGKPVVAIDFNPDLNEFTKDTVIFCKDAASFTNALNDVLANDNSTKQQARLVIAQENTWENRVNQIADLIVQNLN